ncbi:putative inorganic phosphate cotransporter [Episyrphus balteatus]|uniref:putative inorganic phosphate cotransporter n=1 Tax=Episyrphus balteatus TaxID=286459 RepID=UPI002485D633|nr:putative inorganic phosphate cotransporter [Episyrphus balteatus]
MVDNRKLDYKERTFGIRHLQCILNFFGLGVAHALRVNMSLAIVAMTDKSAASQYGVFLWDEKIKSMVLSSFFCGYVFTQVPSGQMAQKYGGHKILFWGIFICSILNILTPICAKLGGWHLVCALRLVQGLCQGCVLPTTHTLLSKWAPIKERGLLGTLCYSGSQFGTALMLCVSGEISASFMGWPGIFYTSGGVGCVWALLFYFFAASSPSESHLISEEERMYIEMLPVPSAESPKDPAEDEPKPKLPTPWSHILTSIPFYCIVVVHCANSWTYNILLTQIPTYFKSIMGMNIKKNALLSSLPFWVMVVTSYFFMFISEVLRKTDCMSLSVSRRFFNTIGNWIPMIGLIFMGYMSKENETLAIILLMVIMGMKAATCLGFILNHIDLSPNFAGTLMGMTNGVAHISSILAPLTVGFIVSDEKNPEQWRIIFFLTAGLLFIGNLLFITFGKFETQYWNELEPVEVKTSKNNSQQSVYKDTVH